MTNTATATAGAGSTTRPEDSLADIRITREGGKLWLTIDAKHLHDYLDAAGARKSAGGSYLEQPPIGFEVVNSNKLSTKLFLKAEYPVKVALNGLYPDPPTVEQLKSLCLSGNDALKTILNHYRPIDISYSIQKMTK